MPQYSRAPIAEAVIDLQVTFDEGMSPTSESLREFAARFQPEPLGYSETQKINAVQMSLSGDGATNAQRDLIGYRLSNKAGNRVLQLRKQGLSLSRLHSYSNWESFVAEFKPLWVQYAEAFSPSVVSRLAVRYINKIAVPQHINLDEYLNLSPRIKEGVGSHVEGYFMQLVLAQRDLGPDWKVIVNTGIEGSPIPEQMTVLLDIDAFCTRAVGAIDSDQIWSTLEQLRDRKNSIFESAITEEVRRMIA